ncbi:MAG: 2-C-methyl-D-erythritol 4-phosphate cytidylyltransferase [Actinomycetota bacterium]|nr:2-C-methyl-D-erythritol 4-phosphate cytidylyltransferase [Actinomycetota bacterium]
MAPETWAIVVAGGDGRRFGAPKQFALLGGRTVLEWSVSAARTVASGVVVVVPRASLDDPRAALEADVVVAGGATRAGSVRAGLAVVPDHAEVVLVHDAARPLASPALFSAVVQAVGNGASGAIPGISVSDTVKRVAGGSVVETLDRDGLVAVQTPQAFRASVLRAAHRGEPEATDDAALLELIGATVAVVTGEETNVKLTRPADLALLESYLSGVDRPVGPRP